MKKICLHFIKNLKSEKRRFIFPFVFLAVLSYSIFAIDVIGNQSGEWNSENNPYNMIGDITVPANEILTINAGVEVIVQGNYLFTVAGKLLSLGTEEDSIFIHSNSEGVNWNGIRLENEIETSVFQHCRIENAELAIKSVNSAVNIVNCTFFHNEKAIDIFGIGNQSNVLIQNCFISDCLQNGIYIVENSNVQILNCEITRCALDESPRGAIMLSSQGGECNPLICGNNIHHNVWQGITAWDITGGTNINPQIKQNEISYNLTGIYLYYASGIVDSNYIHHNFVSGNPNSGAGIMVSGASSHPIFTHNEITGNFTGFYITDNAIPNLGDLSNYCSDDDGENQIYENIDESENIWSVYNMSSQDIKAENNYWGTTNENEISQTVFDGNDNPIFGIVDFEPLLSPSQVNENWINKDFSLTNYPNPFRTFTKISFNPINGKKDIIEINIYNSKGQRVKKFSIVPSEIDGKLSIIWDGKDEFNKPLNSGIYFYQLRTGNFFETKKMIFVK